ncbi:MAG: hypothetical protein WBG90_21925 [Saonia sp.]
MKDDSKEIATEVISTLSQIFIGAMTAVASGSDPYTAGAGVFFGQIAALRSKLKINRVENFVMELGKYMESKNVSFDWENVNSHDFGDFFEEILMKISRTSSENKLERFKLLVMGQIVSPISYNYILRFVELVDKLQDLHIDILTTYVSTEDEFIKIQDALSKIYKEKDDTDIMLLKVKSDSRASKKQTDIMTKGMERLKGDILDKQNGYNRIRRTRNSQCKILGENEFNYILNDLRVMGLIYNPSEGRASDTGEYSGYRCTPLAIGFIGYLSNETTSAQ